MTCRLSNGRSGFWLVFWRLVCRHTLLYRYGNSKRTHVIFDDNSRLLLLLNLIKVCEKTNEIV
jgi:hypothetical protein